MCVQWDQITLSIPNNLIILKNDDIGTRRISVSIDRCMIKEIKNLRNLWIITTWCCCWHWKQLWYIWVKDKFIEMMHKLWYKHRKNELYPDDNSHFIPNN